MSDFDVGINHRYPDNTKYGKKPYLDKPIYGTLSPVMKTSLILHGHFYQPPRENPSTGIIPLQESAAPWTDWNEKIYSSCYGANLSSRYLDSDGRVISISNNYRYISFNFGPTLLRWAEKTHPELIEGLRDADRDSIRRLGHGNAMAQSFNHTILPLDTPERAKHQIEWGIEDFIHHYGREPEGMWLPECAVNESVVDILSQCGIKFVVLSPWQAESVEEEDGSIRNLGSFPAPSVRPYILTGEKGREIAAFFYEPDLASSISFGHALRSADSLYSTLLGYRRDGRELIHTATDGEIYGHHEPYGDMALAALIRKVGERDDFLLDNYASFLERHPATLHAFLRPGDERRGTSWSCAHGVGRWMRDCGCHTGGPDSWNQKWRTGLRGALDNLDEKVNEIFEREIQKIFGTSVTPSSLLSSAGAVFSGRTGMKTFLSQFNLSENDEKEVADLLNGMKYMSYAFTSCGFFFSDISGLEPRQDIKYALHAVSIFQNYTDDILMIPFLNDLRKAKSNVREVGDGALIAQKEMEGMDGECEACVFFYLNMKLAPQSEWKTEYGFFHLDGISVDGERIELRLSDESTGHGLSFRILENNDIDKGINLFVTRIDHPSAKNAIYNITSNSIPPRMMKEAYSWIDEKMISIDDRSLTEKIKAIKMYAMLLSRSGREMDTRLVENLGEALRCARALVYSHDRIDYVARLDSILDLTYFILEFGRESEKETVDEIISLCISKLSGLIERDGLTPELMELIVKGIGAIREIGKEPDLSTLQNAVYPYYTKEEEKTDEEKEVFSVLNFH